MIINRQKKFNNYSRVIFPKNKQKEFLEKIIVKSYISWPEFCRIVKVHPRSFSDWHREKYSLPLPVLKKICRIFRIRFPKNIEIKDAHWSTVKAGKISGKLVYKKYGSVGGDIAYRKKRWRKWWNDAGKNKKNSILTPKKIKRPSYSQKLAEFVGIVLGDGSIMKRQIIICLHYRDDSEYGKFIEELGSNLFSVPVAVYLRRSASINMYVISRTALVDFFVDRLGLKVGNKVKQQVDLPKWIKKNKQFSKAALRGLIDTDGCVFAEKHKINNRIYLYPKLVFTNYSKPLIMAVFNILKDNNFKPKIHSSGVRVSLEDKSGVLRYFKTIKSHNPKHKIRLAKILEGSDSGLFHLS